MPNDNTNTLPTDIDTDDAILPDGWSEGDDFFAPDTWTGESADGQSNTESSDSSGTGESPDGTPEGLTGSDLDGLTNGNDEDAGSNTEGGSSGQETGDGQIPGQRKLKFKARVNHEDQDVELDEGDLPTIWQKAQDYDRRALRAEQDRANNERLNRLDKNAKSLGYDGIDAMLNDAMEYRRNERVDSLMASGFDDATAKDIAALIEQQHGAVGQQQSSEDGKSGGTGSNNSSPAARNFDAELSELLREAPEMRSKTLPDEVVQDAVANGNSLLSAYRRWETKQNRAETERLRKENAVLKQNAVAAAHAPVRGTRGGAAAQPAQTEFERNFLKGFDDSTW